MNRQVVNPWTWQQRAGFVQANDVAGVQRTLYCAGVVSVDDDGAPQHAGDMQAQALRALDNILGTILQLKPALHTLFAGLRAAARRHQYSDSTADDRPSN